MVEQRYEILNPAGQVAYTIPAASQEAAKARAAQLCGKSGVAVTVRLAKQGVGNG